MSENVLITGGAGFIGSHLADALLAAGHQVTALDILHPQVHGEARRRPAYLHDDVTLIRGDVRDAAAVAQALEGKTAVYHFAAYTGVGQSMYQIHDYLDVNVQGTAVLLEQLRQMKNPVRRLVLASSRAVYGEGAYECDVCGRVNPVPRSLAQLQDEVWEVTCPTCRRSVAPIPTPETKPADPYSIYAVSKQNQEQICRLIGETYDIPTVVLRYFNVYGPRQAMRNPYTGVINTFIGRLMNDKPPQVYEDGLESRDFVHVRDVVQACLSALTRESAVGHTINVGSGEQTTLLQAAQLLSDKFDGPRPVVTGQFRAGDIRHCHADLRQAQAVLGYNPKISFSDGLDTLLAYMDGRQPEDLSHIPEQELKEHGLTVNR